MKTLKQFLDAAEKPIVCQYCKAKLGEQHAPDCEGVRLNQLAWREPSKPEQPKQCESTQ